MKYRRQFKKKNCAPLVLYNILIWAGHKKTVKNLEKLCNYSNTTYLNDFEHALNKLTKVKIKNTIHNPKLVDIDKAINKGQAVIILDFNNDNGEGHVSLCIGKTKKYYTLVNDRGASDKGGPVAKRTRKIVSKRLRDKASHVPMIWVVDKK